MHGAPWRWSRREKNIAGVVTELVCITTTPCTLYGTRSEWWYGYWRSISKGNMALVSNPLELYELYSVASLSCVPQ